jgi:hypothetical protein
MKGFGLWLKKFHVEKLQLTGWSQSLWESRMLQGPLAMRAAGVPECQKFLAIGL